MKQILSTIAVAGAVIFGSCNTASVKENETALQAQQRTIDSMKMELVRQHTIDSMNNEISRTAMVIPQLVSSEPKAVARKSTARKSRSVARSSSARRNEVSTYSGNSAPVAQTLPVYQEVPQQEPERKGWSAKAKGAVIGAGAGAIGGAIINKRNRTAGAVIGGVLGAGAGTGIGAIIDKKNGR
jgi:hypothetical protein